MTVFFDRLSPLYVDPCGMDQYNNAMNPTQFGDGGGLGCNTGPNPGAFDGFVDLAPPVSLPQTPEPSSFDLMISAPASPPLPPPAPPLVPEILPPLFPEPAEPEPLYERPDLDRVTASIGRFDLD